MMDVGIIKLKPLTQIKFPENDTDQIQVSQVKLLFAGIKIRKMKAGGKFYVYQNMLCLLSVMQFL